MYYYSLQIKMGFKTKKNKKILRLPQPGGPGSCIYFPQEQNIYINYLLILGGPHRKHKHYTAHTDTERQVTSWPVFTSINRELRRGTPTLGQQGDLI
jgi:hypothetical protein